MISTLYVLSFKNIAINNLKTTNKFFSNVKNKAKKSLITDIYHPKTEGQNSYYKYINNDDIKLLIALGPAGTGKTLFACQKAIIDLKKEKIEKIVITRPIATFEEDIGFLPGNLVKKMDPWTRPIFDIFIEYYSRTELDNLIRNGRIEICPLVFMRGRTFKKSVIIADEMQNSTPNQMKMLTTRIGDKSRMIITGDLKQTDISSDNGLYDFLDKYNKFYNEYKKEHKYFQVNNDLKDSVSDLKLDHKNTYKKDLIKIHYLSSEDIERSKIVKQVIDIYGE